MADEYEAFERPGPVSASGDGRWDGWSRSSNDVNPDQSWVKRAQRRVVILIHGANELGHWQEALRDGLVNSGSAKDVHSVKYTGVSILGVLRRPHSEFIFDEVGGQISDITAGYAEADEDIEFSFVAYSYGTYLLSTWLNWQQLGRAGDVILLASIARRRSIIDNLRRARRIICDVAVKDRIPCWAAAIRGRHFEATGSWGVNPGGQNRIQDRFFRGGHNRHIEIEHLTKNIIPILRGEEPPPSECDRPKVGPMSVMLRRLVAFAAAAVCVTLVVFIGLYFVAPEMMPSVGPMFASR